MNYISISSMTLSVLIFFFLFSIPFTNAAHRENFIQCLSHYSENYNSSSKVIHTPTNSPYPSILRVLRLNSRFNTASTPKPLVILTPVSVSQIQAAITCAKKHGMQIRVRSGGHDYEGLSYVSPLPFVIIDLVNLRKVSVDLANKTTWIQAGATLGEVYYKIAEKTRTFAIPAGVCPTVGVGGHFSGGGYGMLMRKFGLAADNIIDAQLIDVKGRILDRASMGEDLFWAIRGGGGNTFGVIISWKLKLVPVPPKVTVFKVARTLEENATKLVHQWQHVAGKFHEDLFTRIFITKVSSSTHEGGMTVQAMFTTLFLGRVDRLLPLMQESFPELGLVKEDCIEMSWIRSVVYFSGFPNNASLKVLLNRVIPVRVSFKGKTDYVRKPIPEVAFEGIWKRFLVSESNLAQLQLTPYGGKMDEISESSTPFPHRAGNIYKIHYVVLWFDQGVEASRRYINWVRRLYRYMTPYVSKNPRAAYVNYRDLDLGTNSEGNTSYKRASIWGSKYFKNNFDRLVHVKTAIDPTNYFRFEQSIPPLS